MPGQLKKCKICKKELPLDSFYKKTHGKYGVNAICKVCNRIKAKEGYYKDIEKSREIGREKNKKYYKNNKEKIMEYRKLKYTEMSDRDKRDKSKLNILHQWVRYNKKKQEYCTICNQEKKLELSNLSGIYKKDINDYWWLCLSCHKLYDRINKTHTVII